ncbi:hypothetical protein KAU11_03055 [Candidatus Babeliales bacterium]|nr:hypothetical protein [Candidatus Babeliales bacterium]
MWLGSTAKDVTQILIGVVESACENGLILEFGEFEIYKMIKDNLVCVRGFIEKNILSFGTAFVKKSGTKMKVCPECLRLTYWE